MITAALITGLAFIAIQSVALVARLTFIAQLAGRIAGGNSFFQFFNLEFDFLLHISHLPSGMIMLSKRPQQMRSMRNGHWLRDESE
jgi:hypothetical protein